MNAFQYVRVQEDNLNDVNEYLAGQQQPQEQQQQQIIYTNVPRFSFRVLLRFIGPGYLIAVGYMDPVYFFFLLSLLTSLGSELIRVKIGELGN
jgi:hypothetical protein